MKITVSFCLNLFLPLVLICSPASAEIYKYKDKNGRWQFTDKPVGQAASKKGSQAVTAKPLGKNLSDVLIKKFKPQTDIDKASLAVVKIETRVGSGSGFFITGSGYIVTNRHVVRPTTSSQWDDSKEELEKIKEELDEQRADLEDRKDRLKDTKEALDEDLEYIESRASTDSERKRYARYFARYEKDKKTLAKYEKRLSKKEREYKKKKSELGWQSSMSNFSKRFDIKLKNNKKYKAKLVRISKNYDLALLKLSNYQTPFINLSAADASRQGDKVYAIGSPLGYSDSLTSGIITKKDADHLMTDTTILPGNSGGPLLNTKGQLLGVNTAVVSQEKNADGLGLAIYARYIHQEFGDLLM